MEFRDYYNTLGVKPDADVDTIRRAYRKLARKYHPDVSSEADAETRFKDVSEAWDVLGDTDKRAEYDQLREQPRGQTGGHWQPPPNWNAGFDSAGAGNGSRGAGGADFSDFFESMFGRQAGGRGGFAARGTDQRAVIRIDLQTAYNGGTRSLQLREPTPDGGARTRTLNVKIPAGVKNGQHIRLRGQGTPGIGGGEHGDILLEVEIEPHHRFKLDGRDIHLSLPVTPWEAALGARVKVPTLAGKVELRIPAGSQAGSKLRLKGRGLPGKAAGDQYVTLRVMAPPADSEAVKTAYAQLAAASGFNPRQGG